VAGGDRFNAFRALPAGDEILLDLALASVDGHLAGANASEPLLVALSLSVNDYVGHVFGPDSWEAWDELARLDAGLARLFAALDERLGPRGWSAVLSGDHGVATMPEALRAGAVVAECAASPPGPRRSCAPGGRIEAASLQSEVLAAASLLGEGRWIAGVADPYVFYTRAAEGLDATRRAELDRAVAGALSRHPAVERAVPVGAIPRECPAEHDALLDALICEAFPPGSPGDVYFTLRPGFFVDSGVTHGKGSSHGSPHDYDRTVPLVVRAPGRVAAGRVIAAPMDFRAFARTAAAVLGIEPPPSAKPGEDLTAPSS
jgi:hypothetical protein